MDYAKLLNRSFNMIWNHKFLIVLGILVALGGGSPGSQVSWRVNGENNGDFNVDIADFPRINEAIFHNRAIPLIVTAVTVLLIVAVAIWVVSQIARGGLISSVSTLETGATSSFAFAWRAGRERMGNLIGIGLTPLIPILVFMGILLIGGGFFAGMNAVMDGGATVPLIGGISSIVLFAACIAVPLTIGLSLLRIFAERACMIEGLGVYDSYLRGWEVAKENLGDAIVLAVLQIVISIGLVVALAVLGLVMAFSFLLWPILLLTLGAITAVFSSMWTLAWREWTGIGALSEFDTGDSNFVPQSM